MMNSLLRRVASVGIVVLVVAFALPTAVDSFLSIESVGFAGITEGLVALVVLSVVIVIAMILKEVVL